MVEKKPWLEEPRKYFEPYFETMPREEIKEIQNKKLKALLERGYNFAPSVRKLFEERKITPSDIKTTEDFQKKIPTMFKDTVRELRSKTGDPFGGFLVIPPEKVKTVQHSTGTTGVPTFIPKTDRDFEWITREYARHAWMNGTRPGDNVLVWGYYWHAWLKDANDRGFQACGAQVWEFSSMPTDVDIERIHGICKTVKFNGVDHGTLPFFRWMDWLRAKGLDPKKEYESENFKFIRTEGDMIVEGLRRWSMDFWGTIHMDASGGGDCIVSCSECPDEVLAGETKGMHLWEDLFFLEVVDLKTQEPVADGEVGQYCITPLDYEALCYPRWNYEDLVVKTSEKCVCGRTHARILYKGRTDFGSMVKGKLITQRDAEEILYAFPEITLKPYQFIRGSKDIFVEEDTLRIRSAYDEKLTKDPEELKKKVEAELSKKLGVPAEIEWIKPEEARALPHKVYKLFIRPKA